MFSMIDLIYHGEKVDKTNLPGETGGKKIAGVESEIT